jgi:hypothetical protein
MSWDRDSFDDTTVPLVRLVYELLDAHEDTTQLMGRETPDIRWQAHLDYLRALQRAGREVLADALASRSPAW